MDSHLICSGDKNYHIYYGMKDQTYIDVDSDMIGHVVEYASLDVDDTSSYGPETTTVKIGDGNSYIYAVHNFSDGWVSQGDSGAWNLARSGARVVVYSADGIIFDGSVPTNEQGITWEVFRMNRRWQKKLWKRQLKNAVMVRYKPKLSKQRQGLGNSAVWRHITAVLNRFPD